VLGLTRKNSKNRKILKNSFLKLLKSLKKTFFVLFRFPQVVKNSKRLFFCVSPNYSFIIEDLRVFSRSFVPVWEVAHEDLTIGRWRAKTTSTEHVTYIF